MGRCLLGTSGEREAGCQDTEGEWTSGEAKGKGSEEERERRGAVAETGASGRRQEEKTRVCINLSLCHQCHLSAVFSFQ